MLKFIRGRGSHPSGDSHRVKHQKSSSLFSFNKTVPHGFPHRPAAVAHDSKLGLLAIATRNGLLRVYGKPGVEFQVELKNETEIRQLAFIEGRGQLVLLCEDSSIQMWEVNIKQVDGVTQGLLELVKSCDHFSNEQREGTLKQLTTFTIHSSGDFILVGTQGGNVYMVNLDTLELSDQIIYQDVVLQNVPDDYKKSSPGDVEVIAEQPHHPDKFLIGYNRGLLVLWDNKTLSADHFYVAVQQLESVCWLSRGDQFMSAHNDGSYILWRVTDNLHPSEPAKIPYGPFPCKPILKIICKTVRNGDDYLFFSGGMPRASYADKNTITIIQGTPDSGKHHVLDFTSKVIDFTVIDSRDEDGNDNPKALIVLAEEEVVVIDLTHSDWLQFRLPYLSSVHSSAITCCQHYADVPEETYRQVIEAGQRQTEGKYTSIEWPITGGRIGEGSFAKTHDLLITGHEDGSIRFWDSSDVNLHHVYTVNTSKLFIATDDDIAPIDGDEIPLNGADDVESEWPPFRKVGTFDPFSDDPRLAIRKIVLCPMTGTLTVAGTAGQVLVFEMKDDAMEKMVPTELVNIVSDKEGFIWKGHDQLHTRHGSVKLEAGFQPQAILQLSPPAAVTALAFHSEWNLLAAGTAHGFGLFDYVQHKGVFSRSTLNPTDLTATAGGDALISRRKSFKKSLRESFRRLRKGRSQRKKGEKSGSSSPTPTSSPSKSADEGTSKPSSPVKGASDHLAEAKPVERQIEARSDDGMGSVVRCLYLAPANITTSTNQTPTLWAGTNAGAVYVFAITLPAEDKRATDSVTCQLGKEIQLKHRAPVVFIQVIDNTGYPIPQPFEVKKGKARAPSTVGNNRVLIVSEEQFKLFTLPTLKPYCKSKLTAHEGSRARRIAIGNFTNKADEKQVDHCMVCLSNQGDISIYSIPDLKRQFQTPCIKREDVHGISSLVFTKAGEGLFLQSPCEFRRFTLSATRVVNASGLVDIPEGGRPLKASEQRPPIAAASVAPETENGTGAEAEAKPEEAKKDQPKQEDVKPQVNGDEEEIKKEDKTKEKMMEAEPEPETETETPKKESPKKETPKKESQREEITNGVEKEEEMAAVHNGLCETPTGGKQTNGIVHATGINGAESPAGDEDEQEEEEEEDEDELDTNINVSHLTNDTSLDITIDSVKDHFANLNIATDVQDEKPKKVLTPPPPTEATPIINSHEG